MYFLFGKRNINTCYMDHQKMKVGTVCIGAFFICLTYYIFLVTFNLQIEQLLENEDDKQTHARLFIYITYMYCSKAKSKIYIFVQWL